MKERLLYIDSLKGFAILLMVMGHVIAWNFSDWSFLPQVNQEVPSNYLVAGVLWNFIYSFHMPLFFCISGFFCYKEGESIAIGLHKKTKDC